jgi:hypothetical protein
MTEVKKSPKISEARLSLAAHTMATMVAKVEAGTPPDALLDPAYWTHVASRHLRPLYEIIAYSDDGAWRQHLVVLYVGENRATVSRLSLHNLDQIAPEALESDAFEVKFSGPVDLHRVIRKSDGAVMGKGFRTKAEAATFLQSLLPAKAA